MEEILGKDREKEKKNQRLYVLFSILFRHLERVDV